MAPIKNFFVASLGLLSMATSVFAVNKGKTALSVTCFDTTGGVGGNGRLEKIAPEVDSTAVDAIIAGVGAANPNFSCARGRGGGLTCKSSLRAANKSEATGEIRTLLTEVRALEKAHLAANPPAGAEQDCGEASTPAAARRSLISSLAKGASKLIGKLGGKDKGKSTPTSNAPAPAAPPKVTGSTTPPKTTDSNTKPAPGKACKKPVGKAASKRGSPTVMASWLARAHLTAA